MTDIEKVHNYIEIGSKGILELPFANLKGLSLTEVSLKGVNFEGANLEGANLFKVVDAKGDKMNQAETVTLFNDMCFIAPATLIGKKISWEVLNETTVKGVYLENIR